MHLYWMVLVMVSIEAQYTEHLRVQESDKKVYVDWSFSNHNSLLITDLVTKWNIREFNLTFTQGRPYINSAPTGVQLLAWHKGDNWHGFVNALSGLFCASINFMDEKVTTNSKLSFQRPELTDPDLHFRYGALPREIVCTENLTPWAKLLPCSANSGIASLFNAYRLFDASYHSIGIQVSNDCSPKCKVVIRQTLSIVTDPIRILNSRDWSLSKLFDRKITKFCPLSTSTTVSIGVSEGTDPTSFEFTGKPFSKPNPTTALYSLDSTTQDFDAGIDWIDDTNMDRFITKKDIFNAQRYTTGFGQERGGLAIDLYNRAENEVNVTLFQMVPWYLKFYIHTLCVKSRPIGSEVLTPSVRFDKSGRWRLAYTQLEEYIQEMYYQPAKDRGRPSVFEMKMKLKPTSKTTLTIDFDKAFIRFTEHPPDADHGFDMSALIATVEGGPTVYTTNLIINLPTPDFSMPYNVITLTCTVLALLFGSIFNLSTRDYGTVSQ